jgi:hypothetical protein
MCEVDDMTEDDFKSYAQAFGADIARWPDAVRTEALALLRDRPELTHVLSREGALDRLLRSAQADPPAQYALQRVETAIFKTLAATKKPWWYALHLEATRTWRFVGYPAAVGAGIVAALALPVPAMTPSSHTGTSLFAAAFDMDPYGLDVISGDRP